jgi:oligopeptide/dipeptide ABC transporter ATP-binding protein
VQAQILNLMLALQREVGMSYLFISHDLGVIRRVASHVAVMYLGKVVETAPRAGIYRQPLHPYTQALMQAAPYPDPRVERQRTQAPIPGEVPSAIDPPAGCRFHPRCPLAQDSCRELDQRLAPVQGREIACHIRSGGPP